jgi:hypothetical protein
MSTIRDRIWRRRRDQRSLQCRSSRDISGRERRYIGYVVRSLTIKRLNQCETSRSYAHSDELAQMNSLRLLPARGEPGFEVCLTGAAFPKPPDLSPPQTRPIRRWFWGQAVVLENWEALACTVSDGLIERRARRLFGGSRPDFRWSRLLSGRRGEARVVKNQGR